MAVGVARRRPRGERLHLSDGDHGGTVGDRCGGVKGGITYGETDDFSYNVVKDPVHIHALNATILHTLGIDHKRLTYRHQGLDMRLTGVEPVEPVMELLA